jgi:hypothetical protein
VHLSAQCINVVTNITVDGLASETDGYSAVEEVPHIYGNNATERHLHLNRYRIPDTQFFLNFQWFTKLLQMQEARCTSEYLFIIMLCTLFSESV